MKKILLNLLTVLIIANVSVAVVSCGDADGEIDYAVLIPGHWFDIDASEDAYVTMSIDYKGAGTIYYNDLDMRTGVCRHLAHILFVGMS